MDQTALVRVNARRALCHAAGSLHLESSQRCSRGGNTCSTLSSSSLRRLPCNAALLAHSLIVLLLVYP
jgi:hypothetical protein